MLGLSLVEMHLTRTVILVLLPNPEITPRASSRSRIHDLLSSIPSFDAKFAPFVLQLIVELFAKCHVTDFRVLQTANIKQVTDSDGQGAIPSIEQLRKSL
jgi:hypothetical protein